MGVAWNLVTCLRIFKIEEGQTDSRTDKDRQPARGKGGGGGRGREVYASSCFIMPTQKHSRSYRGDEKVFCFKNVRVVGEEEERKVSYDVH